MCATRRGGKQEEETSTAKVIVMLMLAIACFGWAFLAAAYAHEKEGWRQASTNLVEDQDGVQYDQRFEDGGSIVRQSRSSLWDFIGNAFRQIPNVFGVLAFSFQNRLWLVILILCLEAGALGLGYAMSKID
ncbi:hypothetical protein Enr10x_26430 [Gimesia panareensis]|uniref:Uncharacterized protein n=1 Tax=Gimesia panareensis TaxID=2527978 RepID=A0A517Q6U6_9PLAN|nr:hypothetical protein [Gimesia panareensis]QDT27326.1 hypothetical protein Enr10x_26430 [Gimesia panareensis]